MIEIETPSRKQMISKSGNSMKALNFSLSFAKKRVKKYFDVNHYICDYFFQANESKDSEHQSSFQIHTREQLMALANAKSYEDFQNISNVLQSYKRTKFTQNYDSSLLDVGMKIPNTKFLFANSKKKSLSKAKTKNKSLLNRKGEHKYNNFIYFFNLNLSFLLLVKCKLYKSNAINYFLLYFYSFSKGTLK